MNLMTLHLLESFHSVLLLFKSTFTLNCFFFFSQRCSLSVANPETRTRVSHTIQTHWFLGEGGLRCFAYMQYRYLCQSKDKNWALVTPRCFGGKATGPFSLDGEPRLGLWRCFSVPEKRFWTNDFYIFVFPLWAGKCGHRRHFAPVFCFFRNDWTVCIDLPPTLSRSVRAGWKREGPAVAHTHHYQLSFQFFFLSQHFSRQDPCKDEANVYLVVHLLLFSPTLICYIIYRPHTLVANAKSYLNDMQK